MEDLRLGQTVEIKFAKYDGDLPVDHVWVPGRVIGLAYTWVWLQFDNGFSDPACKVAVLAGETMNLPASERNRLWRSLKPPHYPALRDDDHDRDDDRQNVQHRFDEGR